MSVPKQTFVFPSSSAAKRKAQSLGSSRNRTSTTTLKKATSSSPENCIFCCKKNLQSKQNYFPVMINKALYSKYSSSQNYYFTKDINEILTNSRTPVVIKYKDDVTQDEEEEYLKRFYRANEYDYKIRMLTEYYKFHKDISRMFMLPTTTVLNKYHDKKRRLEYTRVTKMLREENESKNPSPRPKEKPQAEEKAPPLTERILDNLELTNTYYDQGYEQSNTRKSGEAAKGSGAKPGAITKNQPQKTGLGANLQKVQATTNSNGRGQSTQNSNVPFRNPNQMKLALQDPQDQTNQSQNQSVSNTIQDLNMKLGEIISNNSRNYGNYFDSTNFGSVANPGNSNNDPHLNETISNLANFLTFLKKNPQQQKINEIPEIVGPDPNYYQHRYSNTLSESQVKNLGIHQALSMPNTYRGHEIDAVPLTQQVTYHARTNSQSVQQSTSSKTNMTRKPNPSSTATSGGVQHNNFVNTDRLNSIESSPFKENKITADFMQSSAGMGMIKGPTKSANILVSKIKNFDEVLKHSDQNAAFKIHSTQNSQRSLSRESKRASASTNNYNISGKNSLSKTPRNVDSGSREPSITKSTPYNIGPAATNTGSLTKSTSRLNLKQGESTARANASNLGSTQSSLKSTMKVDYGAIANNPTVTQGNFFKKENSKDSSERGLSAGGNSQGDKQIKKTHGRMNSGTVATFLGTSSKTQQALVNGTKMSLPLSSQNFFGNSGANANPVTNLQSNPQSFRDLKSRNTYYEQRRQPSSLAGSLSKRDLNLVAQYNEFNKYQNSKEASNQNYGDQIVVETINSARPATMHKYTKSESKYNKMEPQMGLKAEEPLSHRKFFQETTQGVNRQTGGKPQYGGTTNLNTSPTKQIYTYNQNNIVNIFLQPNQETYKDQNIVIKTETDRYGTTNGSFVPTQQEYPSSKKLNSKKVASPNGYNFINETKDSRINSNLNSSPFKVGKKEEYAYTARGHQGGTYSGMSATSVNFMRKQSKKQF